VGEEKDPEVQRYLAIGAYAKKYEISPVQARMELDTDPEHLGLIIMDLDAYLECKHDFDTTRDVVSGLQRWEGSPYLEIVETHTYELRQARLAQVNAAREPVNG